MCVQVSQFKFCFECTVLYANIHRYSAGNYKYAIEFIEKALQLLNDEDTLTRNLKKFKVKCLFLLSDSLTKVSSEAYHSPTPNRMNCSKEFVRYYLIQHTKL